MNKYLKQMRVTTYPKNLIIMLPIFFGGGMFELDLLTTVILGVISFCFLSSAVYVINDLYDVEKDRNHNVKRHRPLASGDIAVKHAKTMVVILLASSVITNLLAVRNDYINLSWALLAIYLAINLGYSRFGWKNMPIVDLTIIASGFLLRLIYGSVITNIGLSSWMVLVVISLSFYFGLLKRKMEKQSENKDSREVLRFYDVRFLDKNLYMCLALSIVFYALWAVDPATTSRLGSEYIVWTVPLVIVLCMRYNLIVESTSDSNVEPMDAVARDRPLQVFGAIYIITLFLILYGHTLFGDILNL